MAQEYSFDIISKVDTNIVDESISVTMKEITNRYDFKDTNSEINFDKKENKIYLISIDEYKVKTLYDVLLTRMAKRNLPLKNFKVLGIENTLGSRAKMVVQIQQGIPQDKAKEIVKTVKDAKLKVNSQIQGDLIRVFSKSKDELQKTIAYLKSLDFGITLIFTNYR
ncbi:MAG: YajQ family cyclic di-GMP-binding protein [Elusimicrobiales bacterium]|nr:YajQ family cyclic di-GMP-binding protein [Elusimicrobiales bacterium]